MADLVTGGACCCLCSFDDWSEQQPPIEDFFMQAFTIEMATADNIMRS